MKRPSNPRYAVGLSLLVVAGVAAGLRLHRMPVSAPGGTPSFRAVVTDPGHQSDLPLTEVAAVPRTDDPDLSEPLRESELATIREWAGVDPKSAADWVHRLPAGPARSEAIQGVAIVWADRDLPAAIQWVRQMPPGADQQAAARRVAGEAVRTAPVEALTLAQELPADQAQADLIILAAAEWAATEPVAAAEWAEQIPDDTLRESVLASIATAWSDSDPVAAANLAVNSIAEERKQDDAIVGIVQRWAQQDKAVVTAWVAPFPAGPLRDTAMEVVAESDFATATE